ncbi:hypothetical protein Skr01_39650 [Sphaerisporangium krabiense]|uniref:DNA-binding PadR family transcriptional regulator n=1 Tax=Sphaerisporangium krabiense TaxID=763782 RepID=A0A7W9DSP0_9ACTN|nr:PadR family transcriptional regulator [Sphaerisporangium krabiense]MBB5629781.1 DNA-binding PadR family transcriptional regulator [Sphaerisporangium krabiense]GII63880.1 hypothetical protein Skr01_39650 [Sphaerisporangium krabiense]
MKCAGLTTLPVAANTLYPLLRRLESQGLLTSEWDTTESRPRKFYRTSRDGIRPARAPRREWTGSTPPIGDLPARRAFATPSSMSPGSGS